MDIGGFLLGAVVAAAVGKVLWDKEKAKRSIALSEEKQEVEVTVQEEVKKDTSPAKKAPAKKAPAKKKPVAAKKKAPAASKAKKATPEDVEAKIKDAVGKLKASGDKISLAAVSRESGISYSRVKRQKELVEKYQ